MAILYLGGDDPILVEVVCFSKSGWLLTVPRTRLGRRIPTFRNTQVGTRPCHPVAPVQCRIRHGLGGCNRQLLAHSHTHQWRLPVPRRSAFVPSSPQDGYIRIHARVRGNGQGSSPHDPVPILYGMEAQAGSGLESTGDDPHTPPPDFCLLAQHPSLGLPD